MSIFLHHIALAAPLFILIFVGFALIRWAKWSSTISEALTRFVFSLALPALLFHMMSDLSRLPPVDARLLMAFFGGCLIVFVLGRLIAHHVFALDGVGQSLFALSGIFSNNVLLGLPLVKVALGDAALPSVALVLVFNALILWTLVTLSVEWARHGALSLRGFGRTARSVVANPIIVAILSGTVVGLLGLRLPSMMAAPLGMVSHAAAPMSLIALGMGLAEYGVGKEIGRSATMAAIKLIVLPAVVWLLALALGLPRMETQVVVVLSSLSTGANVYLMARQFKAMEGEVATSLVLTTFFAAFTTPLVLTLLSLLP